MEEKNVIEETVETQTEEITEEEFLDLGVEMPDEEEITEENGGEEDGTNQ